MTWIKSILFILGFVLYAGNVVSQTGNPEKIKVLFAGKESGAIPITRAQSMNYLVVKNCEDCKVIGFSMIMTGSGKLLEFKSYNSKLSAEMKKAIAEMKTASTFQFVEIKVESMQDTLHMPSMYFKLY